VLVNKDCHQPTAERLFAKHETKASVEISKCVYDMERLRKKILLKLSVRVEVSSVESNETTAATVSCGLAPPPQRRRRRHPPPAPPRNLPFVTFQGSKETFLSLHNPEKQ